MRFNRWLRLYVGYNPYLDSKYEIRKVNVRAQFLMNGLFEMLCVDDRTYLSSWIRCPVRSDDFNSSLAYIKSDREKRIPFYYWEYSSSAIVQSLPIWFWFSWRIEYGPIWVRIWLTLIAPFSKIWIAIRCRYIWNTWCTSFPFWRFLLRLVRLWWSIEIRRLKITVHSPHQCLIFIYKLFDTIAEIELIDARREKGKKKINGI